MVLVAPHRHSCTAGDTPDSVEAESVVPAEVGVTGGTGSATGRHELLALLRAGGGRPVFDPGLSGGLRAWLEDAAAEVAAVRGDGPPLSLGPRVLSGGAVPATNLTEEPWPAEYVVSVLVRVLFRQLVITGSLGDPLTDAVDGLRVDPWRADLLAHLESLHPGARKSLRDVLEAHVGHLTRLTPHFAASWLPRTADRVAIPLAGGRVMLTGVFDLLVGTPTVGTASVCALGLDTGRLAGPARSSLHYLALLETLRNGTPPFRLGLIHTASGQCEVEDVREEHLISVVSHLVAHLTTFSVGRAATRA